MSLYCRAPLNFASDTEMKTCEVEIRDGRAESDLRWEDAGFELMRHASAVDDWSVIDDDSVHYTEIGDLARSLTGCDATLYYPALVRDPENAAQSADLAPVALVHSDYTEGYRAMIEDGDHPYRAILKPSMERAGITGEDIAAARRVLTLQFWRNTGPTRPRHPLAFCDARSVSRDALHPLLVPEYGGVPTQFHSFVVAPPESGDAQRWFTFPDMRADEVVVFRAYDSERVERGEPFWTPHTAFEDPVAGPDAPPRRSVEMRAICLFLG